jgi:hypothetical protein
LRFGASGIGRHLPSLIPASPVLVLVLVLVFA